MIFGPSWSVLDNVWNICHFTHVWNFTYPLRYMQLGFMTVAPYSPCLISVSRGLKKATHQTKRQNKVTDPNTTTYYRDTKTYYRDNHKVSKHIDWISHTIYVTTYLKMRRQIDDVSRAASPEEQRLATRRSLFLPSICAQTGRRPIHRPAPWRSSLQSARLVSAQWRHC
jgi:hypothetical protein